MNPASQREENPEGPHDPDVETPTPVRPLIMNPTVLFSADSSAQEAQTMFPLMQITSQLGEIIKAIKEQGERNLAQERLNERLLHELNELRTNPAQGITAAQQEPGPSDDELRGKGPSPKSPEAENHSNRTKRRPRKPSSDSSDSSPHSGPSKRRRPSTRCTDQIPIKTHAPTDDWFDTLTDTPFVDEISMIDAPAHFTAPKFSIYDGTTDPGDHIIHYRQAMIPTCIPNAKRDAMMCKVFASSLRGSALVWFNRLPPYSIDSFNTLAKLFMAQFASSRKYRRDPDDLYRITQKEAEPLREFIQRFNDAKVEVVDCPESVACTAFRKGLRPSSPLYISLTKTKPKTMLEALQRAQKYVTLEEDLKDARKESRTEHPEQSGSARTETNRPSKPRGEMAKDYNHDRRPSRTDYGARENRQQDDKRREDRFKSFNLNVSPLQLVEHLETVSVVNWPKPMMSDPKSRNLSKWCAFHRESGHTTEECRHLKREVADLIKRGYLKELQGDPNKKDNVDRAQETRKEEHKIIYSIHGGIACGGESNRERRIYARESIAHVAHARSDGPSITFTVEDMAGSRYPHDDALVITLQVGNCSVKRILVDNGSSADIIFLGTVNAMGIDASSIQATKATLISFNGDESRAVGKITLPVTTAGEVRMTTLMVVDSPSAYNMILGRPWLHAMKAVPSTYHQKIKFPTKEGTGELQGEQAAARVCYVKTLEGKIK